jgi:hypothetical protein
LLGIKVIKLNKTKCPQTSGANLLAAQNRRKLHSKLETSGYQLKPKPIKPNAASPPASEKPTVSAQNLGPKIGVGLMPNEKS